MVKMLSLFRDMATVTARVADYNGADAIDGYNPADLETYLVSQYQSRIWNKDIQMDIDENKDAIHAAKEVDRYSVYGVSILVAIFSSLSQSKLVDDKTAEAFVVTTAALAIALIVVKAVCDPVASAALNANMRLMAVKKYAHQQGLPCEETWVVKSRGTAKAPQANHDVSGLALSQQAQIDSLV